MTVALAALFFIQVQPTQSFADLGKTYGVNVDIVDKTFELRPSRAYTVGGSPAPKEKVDNYAKLFVKEWSLYPSSLMKKAQVSRIAICVDLNVNKQRRSAVPAFEIDTMFYDPALGDYAPQYQRVVVHHEFFHMIDYRMGVMRVDKEWARLNAAGFKYGAGGHTVTDGNASSLRTDMPGFLTSYSVSAIEEDKAELFARMIVYPKFVGKQCQTDAVLAKKVALIKKRLLAFDSNMNDAFWKRAQADRSETP